MEALAESFHPKDAEPSKIARELGYRIGSRTDRGVSALANVVSIRFETMEEQTRTEDPSEPQAASPLAMLGRVNELISRRDHPLWVTAWAEVPADFNPRHAVSRTYLYRLAANDLDVEAMRATASLLTGEHDFGTFCRRAGESSVLELDSLEITPQGSWLALRFTALAFRWQLVRRLVAALEAVGQGRSRKEDVQRALERPEPERSWGAAPAEGLILERVDYQALVWQAAPGRAIAGVWAERRRTELTWELEFTQSLQHLANRSNRQDPN